MSREVREAVLPPVDTLYWLMILAATALGEKVGDLVSMTLGLGYGPSSILLVGGSLAAILVQIAMPRDSVPLYWVVVVLTSTAGTVMSDWMARSMGLGYGGGSLLLLGLLACLGLARHRLAIGAPGGGMSRRVEALYWSAMLVAGTLGTASGDFLATGAGLGFGGAALFLAALLAAFGALAVLTRTPREVLYWSAILVGNPLGATMGDYLDKPDGLGLGVVAAVLILSCTFAAIVAFSMRRPQPASVSTEVGAGVG